MYFKDIDLSGKIVLQASFEFTTLENTRDLGSYIPNSAKRLGDGAEASLLKCYVLGSGEAHALRVSKKTKEISKALGLQRLLAGKKFAGGTLYLRSMMFSIAMDFLVHEFIPDGIF